MGDNQDNRVRIVVFWGFVPRDLVIGRAMFVYWSYEVRVRRPVVAGY